MQQENMETLESLEDFRHFSEKEQAAIEEEAKEEKLGSEIKIDIDF